MIPFAKATSHDVYQLLSTIHGQLDREEKATLRWRRDIQEQLRRMDEALVRIETAVRR